MNALRCPACTAPGLVPGEGGGFHCNYCGTQLQGQPTRCPACGWENPQGAEICSNCSEPLSLAARVITRQGAVGQPFWLSRLRSRVGDLKDREAQASEQRLQQLWEVDRRRKLDEARVLARQRAADRQIALVLGVALGILGLVLVALVVLSARGG